MPSDEYTTIQVNLRGMFASQLGRLTTTVDILLGSSDARSTPYQLVAEHHHATQSYAQCCEFSAFVFKDRHKSAKDTCLFSLGREAHAEAACPRNIWIALNATNPKYHQITQSGQKCCASMIDKAKKFDIKK